MDEAAAVNALSSCLCCLQRMQEKNIKETYEYQGKTEKYIDMLKECLDITIDIGSDTVGICAECVGRLRDASNFKEQVQRCQVEVQKLMLKAMQLLQEEGTEVKSEIDYDYDDGKSDNLLEDEPEVKLEMSSEEDETGGETCRNPAESPAQSEPSGGAARDEVSAAPGGGHMSGSGARAVSARARQQLAMTCVVRLERLRQRRICHSSFDQEPTLTAHKEDTHADSAGLRAEAEACTCDTCGEQFTDKIDLIKHVQKHMKTSYSCKICCKVYKDKNVLKRHVVTHTGSKPYCCEICNKNYARSDYLVKHIKIHTGQKPYKCEICKKLFTQKVNLKTHIRIHTGEKPYSCKVCNKQFTQKSSLAVHSRTHTGHTPFSCEICNKRFTDKSTLTTHIRIHTGEKPYSCEICKKEFNRAYPRNLHLLAHTHRTETV